MKAIIYLFFVLVFLDISIADVIINEIMYNPDGSDEGHEWIEIYSDRPTDISNWKLNEDETDHGLMLIQGDWILDGYAVIADKYDIFLEDYPDYKETLIDSSWGSLNNDGEYLGLKNNLGELIDELIYSNEWGGTDVSLERINQKKPSGDITNWADSLYQNGTPGEQNSLFGSCDWSVSIIIDDPIWHMQDDTSIVKWKIRAEEDSDEGEINLSYWIEDPSGDIIKSAVNKDTNISNTFGTYQKTFHNSGGYIIFANITSISCKDYNPKNNYVRSAIIVTGNNNQGSYLDSSIKILDVPSSVKFGDTADIKINVYRGDTSKYAVYAYIENKDGKELSEKTTMHFKDKFTNYTLTIPIQLKPNCDKKYDDSRYIVVVEGLDKSDDKNIDIEGISSSLCKETTEKVYVTSSDENTKSSNSGSSSKLSYELVSKPAEINIGEEFQTLVRFDGDNNDHNFEIWSYVYRGSKCYSGEREDNKKSFVLRSGEVKDIDIYNSFIGEEPGDYKFKIRIQKDDQKTVKEITEDIKIVDKENEKPETEERTELQSDKQQGLINSPYAVYNPVNIYESSSFKAKESIPLFIIAFLMIIAIIFILKKD